MSKDNLEGSDHHDEHHHKKKKMIAFGIVAVICAGVVLYLLKDKILALKQGATVKNGGETPINDEY
jgi:hypothetical protein